MTTSSLLQPQGKRVLMLTDDTGPDRRILQSAETLIAAGYEVTVLIAAGKDATTHEMIDDVRCQRLGQRAVGDRFLWFYQRLYSVCALGSLWQVMRKGVRGRPLAALEFCLWFIPFCLVFVPFAVLLRL